MADALLVGAFWETVLYGNTVYQYLVALGIFVASVFVFKMLQWLVIRSLEGVTKRTKTEFDDAIITVVRTIRPPFYAYLAFYIALRYLHVEGLMERLVNIVLVAWLVYQVVVALQIFIDFYVQRRLEKADSGSRTIMHLVHSFSSVLLWTLGLLFLLQNFGVNVTSLVAGLGIGGVAAALAAQKILGDLFSSLAIYLDKPFVMGDFIEVGQVKGTVERVGIKTTRIKALDGEEVVLPNSEVTASTIQNYGRMARRRVQFTFGVVYDTKSKQMNKIGDMVKNIVADQQQATFERVHFVEFADSSLNFDVVYYVESREYRVYRDVHEAILMEIKNRFEEEGIDMAYPTRVIYNKNH